METYSYSAEGGDANQSQFFKTGAARPSFRIDFADGLGTQTISTVNCVAVDANNTTVTGNVIGTTSVSGSIATIGCLTMGTSGTVAALDGARYRITTTATLSGTSILTFATFILVQDEAYDPD